MTEEESVAKYAMLEQRLVDLITRFDKYEDRANEQLEFVRNSSLTNSKDIIAIQNLRTHIAANSKGLQELRINISSLTRKMNKIKKELGGELSILQNAPAQEAYNIQKDVKKQIRTYIIAVLLGLIISFGKIIIESIKNLLQLLHS